MQSATQIEIMASLEMLIHVYTYMYDSTQNQGLSTPVLLLSLFLLVHMIPQFEPYQGCGDGVYKEHRYFYCTPGRALFTPMSNVQEISAQSGNEAGTGLRNREWQYMQQDSFVCVR